MRVVILFLAVGIVAHAAVQPALAQAGGESKSYRYIMGTSIEVEAFGGTAEARAAAIDEAFGAFAEVDRLMSNYRDDSELAVINRDAARQPVRVSDPMMSVLQAAQKVSAQSGGGFDVTVGPLVRLWGFHDKKPHQPTAEEFAAVRPLVDYRNLVLDAAQHTVRFDPARRGNRSGRHCEGVCRRGCGQCASPSRAERVHRRGRQSVSAGHAAGQADVDRRRSRIRTGPIGSSVRSRRRKHRCPPPPTTRRSWRSTAGSTGTSWIRTRCSRRPQR